jgi:hypothetical protein
MQRKVAAKIVETVQQIGPKINDTIRDLMMSGPSGRQFNEYRRLAGEVFGLLYGDMLNRVFSDYPELEPATWKTNTDPPEPPIDSGIARRILDVMTEVEKFVRELPTEGDDVLRSTVADTDAAIEAVRRFVEQSHGDSS